MFNPYIIVPLLVWAIAQFIKFSWAAFRGDIDFKYLYGSGGMPSVHSAVVTSLATTALLVAGPRSPIFGVSLIFAAIVMYDSFGVRRSAGEQAAAINQILDSMDRGQLDHPHIHLRELLGHKPLEVTMGAVLGLILGGLFNAPHLNGLAKFATLQVGPGMAILVGGLAAILILAGAATRWGLLYRYRKVAAVAAAKRRAAWTAWTLAVVGLILGAAEYEKLVGAVWLIWPIVYTIAVIVALFTIVWRQWSPMAAAIADHHATADKQKWLEGPNKKRRAKAARARAKKRKVK